LPARRGSAPRSPSTRPTRGWTRWARAWGSRARACRASCADQLSLAIGKGGQNARLAARLTGWKIDLISKTDDKKRTDLERANRVEVEKLGLGEATTEKLITAGIETVQELVATPLEKLVEIPGIGEKTAEKILSVAQDYLVAHPPVLPEAPVAEIEFTPEMESAPDAGAPDATPEAPAGDGPGEESVTSGEAAATVVAEESVPPGEAAATATANPEDGASRD
jgi:hypothetical protein